VGRSSSSYGFTNEYQSQGKIYLRARHYMPSIGRFLTRDTWGGNANSPMSFNKWGYTEGNPINYSDPSGQMRYPFDLNSYQHMVSSPLTTILNNLSTSLRYNIFCYDPFERVRISEPPEAISLGQMASLYGVTFNAAEGYKWSTDYMSDVMLGVEAVGKKFARILPGTAASAFRAVYGSVNFIYDPNCEECNGLGGYTHGYLRANILTIEFASLSSVSAMRRRNNVVHELGHGFNVKVFIEAGLYPKSVLEDTVSSVKANTETYKKWHALFPDFPNRTDLVCDPGVKCYGDDFGFASVQGNYDWQQNTLGSESEEFADMFLGWTFNKWADNNKDLARAAWMNYYMPGWVRSAAGR
jgi:RHS repeat-associated protein